ncbi:unnamed protein product [Rotaria magnacalcarata]|uniref:Tc1-like transposase DDE domain-containing protein n=2 Tax=Rotaria magnacalcarata TaxID=392030 RepID=A0A8S2NX32_9BILA|nr:unnamed protein product [Rotaria magnacalcarata]
MPTKKGGIKHKRKFSQKVMVWLGVCSQGITPLVIFDEGTVDHAFYIEKVLPVALEYDNKVFGNNWIFQQDGAKPHQHYLTQQWCRNNFPSFIDKDCWPPNSPELNPLNYSIWDELANAIDWNKVKSKSTLIQQLNSSVKKIRESVVLKVVQVGLTDCIVFIRTMEITYDNKKIMDFVELEMPNILRKR